MTPPQPCVNAESLRRWTEQVLLAKGTPPRDAARVTEVMLKADLRGVDTHGVFVCLQPYLDRIDRVRADLKEINLQPDLRILQDQGAALLLDGDWGFGHIAAWEAMELAMERARIHGIGMVSVTRSTHLGMCSFYPLMAADQDMIGLAMTNTMPAAVPTFGRKARLGTNPLSVAAPAGKHPPFEFDMATTVVAGGKVYISHLANKKMPEGWIVDREGKPMTDATAALQSGLYLPLGGAGSPSWRSQGVRAGVGGRYPVRSIGRRKLRRAHGGRRKLPLGDGHRHRRVSASGRVQGHDGRPHGNPAPDPTAPGHDRVLVPGEIEHRTYLHRTRHGIPVPPAVLPWIEETSRKFGIDPLC